MAVFHEISVVTSSRTRTLFVFHTDLNWLLRSTLYPYSLNRITEGIKQDHKKNTALFHSFPKRTLFLEFSEADMSSFLYLRQIWAWRNSLVTLVFNDSRWRFPIPSVEGFYEVDKWHIEGHILFNVFILYVSHVRAYSACAEPTMCLR